MELDPPGAVHQVDERRLPMAAAGGDPSRDPESVLGLGAGGQALMRGPDLGDLRAPLVRVREGLYARLAQPLQLLAPLGEEVGLRTLVTHHGAASLSPRVSGGFDLGD